MPEVKFEVPDLNEHLSYEGDEGTSIMRVAVGNDVPGIIGECGGEMSCGTCHIYLDHSWCDRVPPAGDEEQGMLDFVDDPQPNSRLGCQIRLTEQLNGIKVTVPHA